MTIKEVLTLERGQLLVSLDTGWHNVRKKLGKFVCRREGAGSNKYSCLVELSNGMQHWLGRKELEIASEEDVAAALRCLERESALLNTLSPEAPGLPRVTRNGVPVNCNSEPNVLFFWETNNDAEGTGEIEPRRAAPGPRNYL